MKKVSILSITILLVSLLISTFAINGCKAQNTVETTAADVQETVAVETTTDVEETTEVSKEYPEDWFEVTKTLPDRFKGVKLSGDYELGGIIDDWIEVSKQFEEATGIDLQFEQYPFDDHYERLMMSFMGGNKDYDFHMGTYTWFPDMDPYVADLEELSKIVTDAPPLQLQDYPKGALDNYCYWNDRLIGLPILPDVTFLIWNKDHYTEAGFDVENGPKTWDEVYENGKVLTESPNRYGFALPAGKNIQCEVLWCLLHKAFGGEYYKDDYPNFDSPESVKAIEFMAKNLKEIAPPDATSWDWQEMFQGFVSGQCSQGFQWPGGFGGHENPEVSQVVGKWGFNLTPGGTLLGGWSIEVNKDSASKEAAYLYAAWFTSPEVVRFLAEKGHAPALTSVMNDPGLIEKYPFYGLMEKSLENAFPYPGPLYQDFNTIINQEVNAAVSGEITSQQAADNMQANIVKLLQERDLLDK